MSYQESSSQLSSQDSKPSSLDCSKILIHQANSSKPVAKASGLGLIDGEGSEGGEGPKKRRGEEEKERGLRREGRRGEERREGERREEGKEKRRGEEGKEKQAQVT